MLERMIALGAIAALAGCMTVGPDYKRPSIDTPKQWPVASVSEPVSSHWWKSYGDPVLDEMVEEALVHNLDLRLAIARVSEARAQLGAARADRYPGVSAAAAASRNRASEDSALGAPPGSDPTFSDYTASLNVSYEIDFWGKYRRATEAARAELLSARHNRDAVRIALIGEVVKGYFNLRALDAQVEVTRRTISTRLASTALQRLRFQSGVASEFDLRQVEAQAAQAQALLPRLEQQVAVQENALSVLLGRSPRAIVEQPMDRGAAIDVLAMPPSVPAGLPSDLLERRPDLQQAEQSLVAANARIGQARAAYYPSISLTGLFGGESESLGNLFKSSARVWLFSAAAAQTVFDAGRTASRVEAAQAREQQALARYQSAIQNAFRETLDALVAQRKAREALEAQQARVTALQSALKLAQLRYDNGVSSLLEVLDAERGLLDAQLNRIDAQRVRLAATTDLFKALGGGWDPARPDQTASAPGRAN
ncbi:MAG TPA: efflux transporter outer membrane subunit [Burkholderiales bacterium]|jgi:multidrug efflux system outer membrane protein|nr:efflux transporter outer membrane subunit [Burkholderiales bacterium]